MTTQTRAGSTTLSPTGLSTSTGAVEALATVMQSFSQGIAATGQPFLDLVKGPLGPVRFPLRTVSLDPGLSSLGRQFPGPLARSLRCIAGPLGLLLGLHCCLAGALGFLPGPFRFPLTGPSLRPGVVAFRSPLCEPGRVLPAGPALFPLGFRPFGRLGRRFRLRGRHERQSVNVAEPGRRRKLLGQAAFPDQPARLLVRRGGLKRGLDGLERARRGPACLVEDGLGTLQQVPDGLPPAVRRLAQAAATRDPGESPALCLPELVSGLKQRVGPFGIAPDYLVHGPSRHGRTPEGLEGGGTALIASSFELLREPVPHGGELLRRRCVELRDLAVD